MRDVAPRVYLIAETTLVSDEADRSELGKYVASVPGAERWWHDAESDAEGLIEACGRLCYKSWAAGVNPNVRKVREGNAPYLANVLKSKHGSVLEHASCTFLFADVSRVFTHELVRHRAGCAVSQESMRYVPSTDVGFWWPSALKTMFPHDPDRQTEFDREARWLVGLLEQFQIKWRDLRGLDGSDDFAEKKALTSALRRFAPAGQATAVAWTANFRSLRHVIEQRTAPGAEEEIRLVFDRVAAIARERYPAAFQDFERFPDGAWVPEYGKV